MIFPTVLRLDGEVNQFFVLAQQFAICVGSFRLVRDDRDDGCKFPRAHLPDMEIGHDRVTVSLDRATNFLRQIGRDRRAIEQNAARIAQQAVSPRENNAASDQADNGIEPEPAEELARSQRDDGKKCCEHVGQHVEICGAQVQVMVV